MSIKEQFEKTEKLYHFTSFDTALKIIESNHLRYGRLNNMNDIHENDKIVFVDANNHPTDKFPSDVLDELYDEIYKYRQISLTADDNEGDKDGFDLHQMWGLYADKGEGVCLIFDKKELEKGFGSAALHDRVSYDKTVDSYYISLSNTADKVSNNILSSKLSCIEDEHKCLAEALNKTETKIYTIEMLTNKEKEPLKAIDRAISFASRVYLNQN